MYNTGLRKHMKYSGIALYGGSTELFALHIIPRISKMSSVTPKFLFSDLHYFQFCTTHSFLMYDIRVKFLTNIKHLAKLHPPSTAISVKKHHKITKPFLSFCQFLLNCHHQKKMISKYDQFAVILDKVLKRKYFYRL